MREWFDPWCMVLSTPGRLPAGSFTFYVLYYIIFGDCVCKKEAQQCMRAFVSCICIWGAEARVLPLHIKATIVKSSVRQKFFGQCSSCWLDHYGLYRYAVCNTWYNNQQHQRSHFLLYYTIVY
jgi:hypothetical protein